MRCIFDPAVICHLLLILRHHLVHLNVTNKRSEPGLCLHAEAGPVIPSDVDLGLNRPLHTAQSRKPRRIPSVERRVHMPSLEPGIPLLELVLWKLLVMPVVRERFSNVLVLDAVVVFALEALPD